MRWPWGSRARRRLVREQLAAQLTVALIDRWTVTEGILPGDKIVVQAVLLTDALLSELDKVTP
jgi:hypothetical protein